MKRSFKILTAILAIGFVYFMGSTVEARGAYYNVSAKSNIHSLNNFSQYFKVDAEMVMNGTKGSIVSESHYWCTNKPNTTQTHSFGHTNIKSNTYANYRSYTATSSIKVGNQNTTKPLYAKIDF